MRTSASPGRGAPRRALAAKHTQPNPAHLGTPRDALKSCAQVLCVFVFDRDILAPLPRADRRLLLVAEGRLEDAVELWRGDLLAGLYGAYGVVTALHERHTTGVGRVVRTSLLAALVGAHAFQGTAYTVAGQVGRAQGNHHPSLSPYGLFHCQDGDIQVACGRESLWRKLADAFGVDPAAPGMATNRERTVNRDQVSGALNAAFAAYPLDVLLPRLAELGIPAGEVRTIDRVYDWDQTRSQGLVIEVDHPVLGTIELPGPPIRFDDNGYAGGRSEHLAPPSLGQHDESVRAWLDELDSGQG